MKIFHLSHIDLDGYGCQLVASSFCENISFYNSNYGNEVTARLKQIENDIKLCDSREKILILITDLNMTKDECKYIDQVVARMKFMNYDIEISLLDHHQTGAEQAKQYDWYFLDNTKCATLLTLEYFKKNYPKITVSNELEKFVFAINAFDLWNEENGWFEFGKVLNRYIVEAKEVNKILFKDENVEFRLMLLKSSYEYLDKNRYIELDDDLIKNKKTAIDSNARDTLDNLTSVFITNLLSKRKEELAIHYKEHKGIMTTQIGNTSVLGNSFLKANPEFDFFMDVAPTGNISIRADGKLDVSKMAVEIFDGGGHPNASGGRMNNIKEFHVYKEIRDFVQKFIDSKTK